VRIALLSWESLAGSAWTETAVLVGETARALAACGAEVHVFTSRAPGQPAEVTVALPSRWDGNAIPEGLDGVRYHCCAHDPDPDPFEEAHNLGRAILERLRQVERTGRFPVAHGFEWPMASALGELRQEAGRATVWSFFQARENWAPPAWLLDRSDSNPRWRYHPGEFAGLILAPSEPAQQGFLGRWALPAERVEIVHPGIDPAWPGDKVNPAEVKARYRFDTFDPVVLYIGQLTPQARPGMLLDAMPAVLEKHPDARLVFAGDGELAGYLADRAQVLGIEGAVRLLGEPPGPDLARLCQSCDVVCLPQRSQALLSPYLQAWAAGKPVIVTRSHGAAAFVWPEVTGLVAEDSLPGLAAAVLWMFADFERGRWIGENGRRAVRDAFGWPAISARLLDCYTRVAAERGATAALR